MLVILVIHLAFVVLGFRALWSAARAEPVTPVLALSVASQLAFLGCFGGVITMRSAMLIEQALVVVAIVALALGRRRVLA